MPVKQLSSKIQSILNELLIPLYQMERFYKDASKFCDANGFKYASDFFVCEMHRKHTQAHKIEKFGTNWSTILETPKISSEPVGETIQEIVNNSYNREFSIFESFKISVEDSNDVGLEIFLEEYIECENKILTCFTTIEKKLVGITDMFQLKNMEKKIFKNK